METDNKMSGETVGIFNIVSLLLIPYTLSNIEAQADE